MIQLAINGFGRIGRAALKIALEHPDTLQVVAINDLGDLQNLAYLLRYDSIYGRYVRSVVVDGDYLVIDDHKIKVLKEKDPAQLPWKAMNVDVVIESTGFFTEKEKAALHLQAGAKKVVISAPTSSPDVPTLVFGVNADTTNAQIISNASCTTNCAASVTAVIEKEFGIAKAMLTTVHAYTATQSLVDGPATKDYRRGRAAGFNIVPSSTGASEAIARTLPHLNGLFGGVSLRVPVPVVSISDCTFLIKKDTTVEEVNQAFKSAVENPEYKNAIAITDEPVVSSDFIGDPHAAIVDLSLTSVVDKNLIKVMAWYDNEWGYANRLIDQIIEVDA